MGSSPPWCPICERPAPRWDAPRWNMTRLYRRRMAPVGRWGTRKAVGWDPIGWVCEQGHVVFDDARPKASVYRPEIAHPIPFRIGSASEGEG